MNGPAKLIGLGLSTALAAGLLAGCTTGGAQPSRLATNASSALDKGNPEKAVSLAEQAVLSDPRNAAYRVLLGNAYLRAGRFASAQQAYNEAIDLGADSGKAGLSLALADVAMGHTSQAIDTLRSYRNAIPASDLGLALALAGDTNGGVAVLTDALRGGDKSAKLRQNLAYAYALAGRWREARVMASMDVPADQLNGRLSQWAEMARPEDGQKRVAALLGVPGGVSDAGQPAALALANFPSTQMLAAEAQSSQAPEFAAAATQELPPVEQAATPAPVIESQPPVQLAAYEPPASTAAAPFESAPAPSRRATAYRVVGANVPTGESAAPVTGPAPTPAPPPLIAAPKKKTAAPAPTAMRAAPPERSTHVVQLGSFSTPEGARRAWRHYLGRMPELQGYRNVTTQVTVNGKQYWRVQAAGFAGAARATSLCQTARARFGACLVMAAPTTVLPTGRPMDTRMARRR